MRNVFAGWLTRENLSLLFVCALSFACNPCTINRAFAQNLPPARDEAVIYRSAEIFPLVKEHVHAPTIVELPDGSLLAAWYQGSGERRADDVAIVGARLKAGGDRAHSPEAAPTCGRYADQSSSAQTTPHAQVASTPSTSSLRMSRRLPFTCPRPRPAAHAARHTCERSTPPPQAAQLVRSGPPRQSIRRLCLLPASAQGVGRRASCSSRPTPRRHAFPRPKVAPAG